MIHGREPETEAARTETTLHRRGGYKDAAATSATSDAEAEMAQSAGGRARACFV